MQKPDIFGRYLLIERVSVGGMAEVFKAMTVGLSGFKKTLAIKRVLPNISEDESFVKMFVDEANIAGQLHHANVAQIYDLGSVDNSYFIAMEYVEGKDLRSIFDKVRKSKRPIPVDMAAFVCAQLLAGLDYAHRKKDDANNPMNIVHRDVSPPNILLSYDGDVKLIDFGIAKAAKKASKTQAGVLKGKFSYMSPEQIRGLTVDGRSDVFSVGIVLYEMLAHKRLFVGESDFETLEKVRGMEVDPPSEINEAVPEELDRIVLKALKRDLKERYQSAEEMQHDLQRYLYSHTPVFTERSLSTWMTEVFETEFKLAKERMTEIENLNLNELGINLEHLNRAKVNSLKTDETKPAKTKNETNLKRRSKENTKFTTIDIENDLPVSSIRLKTVMLSIILLSFAIAGWYFLDKSPQNTITLGNNGESGSVVFLANVKDAQVIFRNNTLCSTPCKINDFWAGEHEVTFKHSGMLDKVENFSLNPAQSIKIAAKLIKTEDAPGSLIVRTYPEDAIISVNGEKQKQTSPLSLDGLKTGRLYTITIEKPGYQKIEERIVLNKNGINRRDFTLAPLTPSVAISSKPDKAEIYLDRKNTGKTTPARLDQLEDGKRYFLELKLKGYKTQKFTFTAQNGIEKNFSTEIPARGVPETLGKVYDVKNFGWLNIFTDSECKIYIDNRFTGYSPQTDILLTSGSHELKLVNENQQESTEIINITPGEINRISQK